VAAPIDELSLFKLEELMELQVAAPTKLFQPLREAPSVMSTVSREQIDSYGWLSLNDILYRQPGFAPAQDYERRTVASRGLFESWNNNHLLLLIDGLPQNDSLYGSAYTWEITPLFLVQSLEIVRGPGSALYGTNASNGVLALNSRGGRDSPAEAQVRFGNAGTRIYDLFVGHEWSRVSFALGYNHYATDGNVYQSYDGSGRTRADGSLAHFPVNDARSSDYVFFKLEALDGLMLQFHHQNWSFGTGQGWLFNIPDQPESMNEQRQTVSLSYRPRANFGGRLQQEYAVQYQRHAIDWHLKMVPDGGSIGSTVYPGGLTEQLSTEAHQIFLRAQLTWKFWRDMSLLLGAENTVFYYPGDDSHSSNSDLAGGGAPYLDKLERPLGPWLEPIRDHAVENLGVYLQYATGRILKRKLSLTAGVRYDLEYFEFTDITTATRPVLSRDFNQVSPRVGIVVFPWRDLSLKLMVDRAFRAPTPAELFGANTYTLSSNPKTLQPEIITTVAAAVDLGLFQHLNLRADWFYEIFENQIAYSVSNLNLNANLYSRTITGVELELLFDAPLGRSFWLSGFGNYTFAHLLTEKVEDPAILPSQTLTWAPAHVFNLGLNLVGRGLNVSLQGHFQGAVTRRPSDLSNPYRPVEVAPWFTLDARLSYGFTSFLRVGVQASNLLNSTGYLAKTNAYPFDYRIEGIRVLGTLEVELRKLIR
jgi:iron complex outermembrane receptor protein